MKGANAMKRLLVTLVLALAGAASAQVTSSSPQPGAASQTNIPTSQKVIKDPGEYNAYIAALNETDAAARGRAMEEFVARYPGSIVKLEALEQGRSAYQQAKNPEKVEELARQTLQFDPNNAPALAIVVYMERDRIKDAATGAATLKDAERGLRALEDFRPPQGMTPADFEDMRARMTSIFAGAAAFGALQQQDYAAAQKYYGLALKIDSGDYANSYQMAISLLQSNPMNPLGFWYGAKALSLAQTKNPEAFEKWSPYILGKYKRYHGNTDDWNKRLAAATSQTAPPPDFVAGISLAPTPCDLAAQTVQQNGPVGLSFGDWEQVLSCRDYSAANKTAAGQLWQSILDSEKGGETKLKMPVKVIKVPDAKSLEVAFSDENQAANKTDMKVAMEKPMIKPPAIGSKIDIIGVFTEYTPDPFMFTVSKGEFPKTKPAAKTSARKGAKRGAVTKAQKHT
jgi:tetratricopeptide (TPR) repeat protein